MVSTYTHQRLSVIPQTELTALVGNTPLLPLRRIAGDLWPRVQIYAKAEWFNPSGSVKDRPALNIIRQAMSRGELGNGRRLLDSTSGNMGIAYASLGVSLGIPVTLTIPSNASPERLSILRAFGAELILTDPTEGTDGALVVAREMAEAEPKKYYYANQYDNPANWQAHYLTTGPEIWEQTSGGITHFVTGLGTSGTMTGTTGYLKEQNPGIQSIAIQPDAPFHGLEGLKHMPTSLQPGIYDPDVIDRLVEVSTEKSYEMVRSLGCEEGLFVGLSSGAAALAASEVARELENGVVVTVFPDAGYKYLTTNIWEEPK
jgi:cysteine synthase B